MTNLIDWTNTTVTVTGGAGFLGRSVCEKLRTRGCSSIRVPRSEKYDLTTEEGVARMYDDHQPDVVVHLAAEVGGIGANLDQPGRFFFANLAMGMHLIEYARARQIRKFVQAGTVCAYPKLTPVPFQETHLWDGYPEETNAPYGISKKALFVMLDAYQREYGLNSAVLVLVNLYGPGDNFDLRTSHVIPSLIRKCISAVDAGERRITCWGSGSASREFLYVEDAAEALVRAAEVLEDPAPVNIGSGREITIRELAELIASLTGFDGIIEWDITKPDGQPRRCLDTSRARELFDWQASTEFQEGLRQTIEWYRSDSVRRAA